MFSTSRTITSDRIGYKSVIDKARAIQKEDAELLHQAAKARHAHKLRRANGERERADEAAFRIASSSNLNIDAHYQRLLVEIKENVKATFEAECIAEVREDVYRRYSQIVSEYEAQIKDETYTFLVDSLEPVVKADLRQQLEPQIREELREELRAEMRSELSAEHETRATNCQFHAGRGQTHSKAVQTLGETIPAAIDPSSFPVPTQSDSLDVNVGADEPDNTPGEDLNVAQFHGHQSPLMESVERKEEDGSATPCDNRYEGQSGSRSQSVSSKRSWSSEEDYEENESPSKRLKSLPEDEDGMIPIPYPFDDDPDSNCYQQQASASPPSSDDYFDSEDEEHQDLITPGPFVPFAPQFGQPGSLIAQTNTAEDAWSIPDSDDEEGVRGEVDGEETLVETGFVSVNKAGITVTANGLFLSEGNDGQL